MLLACTCRGQTKLGINIDTRLTIFENKSKNIDYKLYVGKDDNSLLLLKNNSYFDIKDQPELIKLTNITPKIVISFTSLNTLYPSIYLRFGGLAGGTCPADFSGPYYVDLWHGHSDVPDSERLHIRYCQKGESGTLGLRIDTDGNPTIFAGENTKVLDENTTKTTFTYR